MIHLFTSLIKFKSALAVFLIVAAGSLFAGDLTSDSIPEDELRSLEFCLTDSGNTNVNSMAAFASSILHDNEAISLPYLFKAVAANPESAS